MLSCAFIFIDIWIIFLGIILKNCCAKNGDYRKTVNSKLFYFLVICLLIFIAAFRGDFTTDYTGYEEIYDRYYDYSFGVLITRGIMKYPETGYLIFQYIIKLLTDNVLFIFIVSSVIVVCSHVSQIKKVFPFGTLAVFLFVEIGNYYNSFNILRQTLAASIILLGSKYLYERKALKYFCVVVVAATFHKSALVMIPCYFLLNIKLKRKNIFIFTIGISTIFFLLQKIIAFIQKYYWSWYTDDAYGMTGYSINNVIMPIFISVLTLFLYNFKSRKEFKEFADDTTINIWVNSTYLFLTFSLLGLSVEMVQRLAIFFSTYLILLLGKLVDRSRNRQLISIVIIGIVILYNIATKSSQPFYFIWNR